MCPAGCSPRVKYLAFLPDAHAVQLAFQPAYAAAGGFQVIFHQLPVQNQVIPRTHRLRRQLQVLRVTGGCRFWVKKLIWPFVSKMAVCISLGSKYPATRA